MFISGDFKSNDFVRAHSKALTDAFFVSAHPKGVTGVNEHQSIAPPQSREAPTAAALSLVCSFRVARSSHFSRASAARSFAGLSCQPAGMNRQPLRPLVIFGTTGFLRSRIEFWQSQVIVLFLA